MANGQIRHVRPIGPHTAGNSTIKTINSDASRLWHQDKDGTDEKFGAGAQFHFHKMTARLEYERLRFSGDAADTWSLGAAWSFR